MLRRSRGGSQLLPGGGTVESHPATSFPAYPLPGGKTRNPSLRPKHAQRGPHVGGSPFSPGCDGDAGGAGCRRGISGSCRAWRNLPPANRVCGGIARRGLRARHPNVPQRSSALSGASHGSPSRPSNGASRRRLGGHRLRWSRPAEIAPKFEVPRLEDRAFDDRAARESPHGRVCVCPTQGSGGRSLGHGLPKCGSGVSSSI